MDKARGYQRMDPPAPSQASIYDYPTGPSVSVLPHDLAGGGVGFSVPVEHHRASKFHHVADLDRFFTQVYRYHQRNGLFCMLLQDALDLLKMAYVVIFTALLIQCIDYEVLFASKVTSSWREWWESHVHDGTFNETGQDAPPRVTLHEIFQCQTKVPLIVILLMILATLFWLFQFIRFVSHVFTYRQTKRLYQTALKIDDNELVNLTWHEVLQRLLVAQKVHHMCIHKPELTELDVYHRILRVDNYLVAMINKNIIPVRFRVPFLGEVVFFTKFYQINLEQILFRFLGSPFEHNWQLREDYKVYGRRADVAEQLRKRIEWAALINLIFCPVVLVFRVLYALFGYADIIKRDPAALGARRWSYYGHYFLRHFNEVDHELDARLRRGYKSAAQYMNMFTSPVLVILAKNVAFIAGSLLAVIVLFAIVDDDVLKVSHVLTIITVLGVVVAICRACIPDENAVFNPENLLSDVISEIHYAPETWKGRAHTSDVRVQFSEIFQFRVAHICEELISPIATPLILFFALRNQAQAIVDFFRNFTVELTGVGDVCSFAEMDLKKHGDPEWEPEQTADEDRIVDDRENRADFGKTELSLIHFKLTNPDWKPPMEASYFMQKLREQVEKGAQEIGVGTGNLEDNAVLASLCALGPRVQGIMAASVLHTSPIARGHVSSQEGALSGSGNAGLLSSVMTNSNPEKNLANSTFSPVQRLVTPLELTSADMSFSALFLHEIHRKRLKANLGQYGTIGEEDMVLEETATRTAGSSGRSSLRLMEEEEEGVPLLNLGKKT